MLKTMQHKPPLSEAPQLGAMSTEVNVMARLEAVGDLGAATLAYFGLQAEVIDGKVKIGNTHESDTIPSNTFDEAVEKLKSDLGPRIEQAKQDCEFVSSPEVSEAISGYYTDHYTTALVVERVIRGEPVDIATHAESEAEPIIAAHKIATELDGLLDPTISRRDQLKRAERIINNLLFAEASVGQTTITQTEIDAKTRLITELHQVATSENVGGIRFRHQYDDASAIATEKFWNDGRHAGQLEFHNTPYVQDIAKNGYQLSTRAYQEKTTGSYNAVTLDVEGHSQSVHFSESFYSSGYMEKFKGEAPIVKTLGATIAVPLAEVVKQTPFARGGEYGVVTNKPGTEMDRIPVNDSSFVSTTFEGNNPGAPDIQGANGTDRTFYADGVDRKRGEDYAIDFGAAMSSELGNTSHIIILAHEEDKYRKAQFMQDGRIMSDTTTFGVGEGHPQVHKLDFDFTKGGMNGIVHDKPGQQFIPANLRHHANRHGPYKSTDPLLSRVVTENYSYREDVTPAQQEQKLKQEIINMQRISREHPKYRGKFVVMLRGGTMAFESKA